jgi:hypothetical protein
MLERALKVTDVWCPKKRSDQNPLKGSVVSFGFFSLKSTTTVQAERCLAWVLQLIELYTVGVHRSQLLEQVVKRSQESYISNHDVWVACLLR